MKATNSLEGDVIRMVSVVSISVEEFFCCVTKLRLFLHVCNFCVENQAVFYKETFEARFWLQQRCHAPFLSPRGGEATFLC